MPGSGTIGIREFVENELAGGSTAGETPGTVLSILDNAVGDLDLLIEQLGNDLAQERLGGEVLCTVLDLRAWRSLGSYYRNKIAAALELVTFELTGDEDRKSEAVQHLARARDAWKGLSAVWAQHYMPYRMVRSKYTFGWPYYTEAVERDIEIAATWKPRPHNGQ
jgi:hypothetical protein